LSNLFFIRTKPALTSIQEFMPLVVQSLCGLRRLSMFYFKLKEDK